MNVEKMKLFSIGEPKIEDLQQMLNSVEYSLMNIAAGLSTGWPSNDNAARVALLKIEDLLKEIRNRM